MATRSRIGILNNDGTVVSCYVHWDGYPSNNGQILLDHYTDESKIRAMIELGDMSILGREIGVKHRFSTPLDGVCTYYGRDRGDVGTYPRRDATAEGFYSDCEEYGYLWIGDKWMVHCSYDERTITIEDALKTDGQG
jgi:hypothetical protein